MFDLVLESLCRRGHPPARRRGTHNITKVETKDWMNVFSFLLLIHLTCALLFVVPIQLWYTCAFSIQYILCHRSLIVTLSIPSLSTSFSNICMGHSGWALGQVLLSIALVMLIHPYPTCMLFLLTHHHSFGHAPHGSKAQFQVFLWLCWFFVVVRI